MVLTLKSMDKILLCGHSNKSSLLMYCNCFFFSALQNEISYFRHSDSGALGSERILVTTHGNDKTKKISSAIGNKEVFVTRIAFCVQQSTDLSLRAEIFYILFFVRDV